MAFAIKAEIRDPRAIRQVSREEARHRPANAACEPHHQTHGQATNRIVGLSDEAAAFLGKFF